MTLIGPQPAFHAAMAKPLLACQSTHWGRYDAAS
jgi:hypothetical protein